MQVKKKKNSEHKQTDRTQWIHKQSRSTDRNKVEKQTEQTDRKADQSQINKYQG